MQTLDYLGESVSSLEAADAATRDYLRVIDAVKAAGIGRNLSLKLTQLGLDVDRASAVDNLRRILDRAEGFFVRLDMESSDYTDRTLTVFETVWQQDYRHVGVVLQADLRRTEQDVDRINALGARIRLVKGAYREPSSVAYPRKADVDATYRKLIEKLLVHGTYPGVRDTRRSHDRCGAPRGGRTPHRPGPFRVPDAVRHQARSPELAGPPGLPRADLHPVRARVVSVFHATARRTAGKRRVRASREFSKRNSRCVGA